MRTFNEFQTQLTDEVIEKYPKEVIDTLYDYIENVPFIQRLISPDRKRAKDLPRDSEGRIIVDLSNPHILENMDYFRESAIHFKEFGCYTKLKVNTHPQSEYMKWFRREIKRCWEGMVRPEDGEWITGPMYFFLNYMVMVQTVEKITKKGKKIGNRIEALPECWEGIYWRFHYLDQCRDQGFHAAEIASRGKGKAHPYSQEVITPTGVKKWGDINIGDSLFGINGEITKVIDIPYDKETDIYKITLKDNRIVYSSINHLWNVYRRGVLRTMSLKNILLDFKSERVSNARNTKGVEYIYSIPRSKGVEFAYQSTPIDPYSMGLLLGDGTFRRSNKNCIYYTSTIEDMETYKKYIPYPIIKRSQKYTYSFNIDNSKDILVSFGLYMKKSKDKYIPEVYKYNTKQVRLNILKGLMDSDGSVDNNGVPIIALSSKKMIDDLAWIVRSLGYNCNYNIKSRGYKKNGIYKQCLDSYELRIYTNDKIFNLERKNNLLTTYPSVYSKSKRDSTRIVNIEFSHRELAKCVTVDNKSHSYLIGEFIQTHNSYSLASILAKTFTIGLDSPETSEGRKALIVADQKEYLIKDGTLNKFEDSINFLSKHTQFPQTKDKDSLTTMTWICGWEDTEGNKKGPQNLVLGAAIGDNPDKTRGKRSDWMFGEEFGKFGKFSDWWDTSMPNVQEGELVFGLGYVVGTGGCVCAGTKVFTSSGDMKNIEDIYKEDGIIGYDFNNKNYSVEPISWIQNPSYKQCVKITTNSFRELQCSIDHPIWGSNKYDYNECRVFNWIKAGDLKVGDKVAIANNIDLFGNKYFFDARLIGMLIGDGSYISSPRFYSCDEELKNYIKENYSYSIYNSNFTKEGKLFECISIKKIKNTLRDLGILGQSKSNKRLPKAIFSASKKDVCNLIGGLFDTNGNVSIKKDAKHQCTISAAFEGINLVKDVQYLLTKLGIYANINYHSSNSPKSVKGYYSIDVCSRDSIIKFYQNIKFLIKYKQDLLETCYNIQLNKKRWKRDRGYEYETITNIEHIGINRIYNLTASNTHTYLANNIITHNTEGNDFTGALNMINYPEANHIYGLPNIYDKGSNGSKHSIFFFPAYVNYKPYYNHDGVSDIIGAMLSEIAYRHHLKYSTDDPLKLTRRKAEFAFTIQDAIMRRDSTIYPVADLNDRINQIDGDSTSLKDMYVGRLELSGGEVKWKPDPELSPIMNWPHKDNKLKGCVYIKEMPVKDSNGVVPWGRYIGGCILPKNKVLTDRGLVNVEEVTFKDKLVNEEGKYVDIRRIIKLEQNSKPIYKIKTGVTCNTTTFTEEHPILISTTKNKYHNKNVAQKNGLKYAYKEFSPATFKRADEVKVGDWIKYPNRFKKEESINVDWTKYSHSQTYSDGRFYKNGSGHSIIDKSILKDPDFWWMVGLYLGDGWLSEYKIHFAINKKEENYINRLNSIANKINRATYSKLKGNCFEVSINSQTLVRFLKDNVEQYCNKKYIKDWIKVLPNTLKVALVSGYLDSDGCIWTQKKNSYIGEFVSINYRLLEDIQDILNSLEIGSTIKILRKAKSSWIINKYSSTQETYSLQLSHFELLKLKEYKSTSFKLGTIEERNVIRRDSKNYKFVDDFIYIKITDIQQSTYTGTVYNYECDTHTYLCDRITTHNCDPIDTDGADTLSLFSCWILDLWTDDLVAEYTGREDFVDDSFEICRRLLLFYNAECNYEKNKKGLFKHFSQHNCLHLLSDNLEFLAEKSSNKMLYGNNLKGTNASAPTKSYGRRCIRDYLLSPVTKDNGLDSEGNPIVSTIPKLFTIKFRALLQELSQWNADSNFDRHDALVMLMLLREDKLRRLGDSTFEGRYKENDTDYLGNDDFFTINYKETGEDKYLKQLKKLGIDIK